MSYDQFLSENDVNVTATKTGSYQEMLHNKCLFLTGVIFLKEMRRIV